MNEYGKSSFQVPGISFLSWPVKTKDLTNKNLTDTREREN